MVLQISHSNEIPREGRVVLDCFANWCGPCKRIAPAYIELSHKFPTIQFLKADMDECDTMGNELNVSALPTFLFFLNGALFERVEGADLNRIIQVLESLEKAK